MMSEESIFVLIGKKVKSVREEKGKTQQDLAALCNFEKSTISRIEAGRTNITLKNLYKISQALNVKITVLVDVEV